MRAPDGSAADVERRDDDLVCAEPLHPEHSTHDIDDRIEGADFVEVNAIDRHGVDRRLRLRQLLEERDRAIFAGPREGRPLDVPRDVRQAVVRM